VKVGTQTELEKTQLEIAKLQLEQERRKLAGMQRRSEAVGSLGRGVKKAGIRLLTTFVGMLFGALSGAFIMSLTLVINRAMGEGLCPAFPDAELTYRIGCALGSGSMGIAAGVVIGAVWAGYEAYKLAGDQ
jgi:tetrahydromethanopterin S-methyltransferase subunit G